MQIDFAELAPRDRYKLIVGSVVPRPIALVSTCDAQGRANAAPFSFFNAVCDDPPLLAIGVNSSAPGHIKDTARNIRASGEFVVNLVDEALAPRMNACGVDFGPEVNEFEVAGLTARPGVKVRAPWVGEAPIAFECRRRATLELAIERNLVLGEVVYMHVRDDLVDRERCHVHAERAGLIGRMHGLGWYARTADLFDMPRRRKEEFGGR